MPGSRAGEGEEGCAGKGISIASAAEARPGSQVVWARSHTEIFLAALQDEAYTVHSRHIEAGSPGERRGRSRNSSAHNVASPRMVGRLLSSGILLPISPF